MIQRKGLIVSSISNLYVVEDLETKERYECAARGKFKLEEQSPVVGDKVEFEILKEETKKAIINEIMPRNNYSKRPKMANLTQIILVMSLKWPEPDLLLLDKQIAYAEMNQIKPVICINKIDLDEENMLENIVQMYENIGYTVIKTNAKQKQGIGELEKVLQGNITAFAGNSGVGKSTLINSLFSKIIAQEGDISSKIKRGKNTTTNITLYKLKENSYIADTPGFSTFDIFEIPSTQLDKYFIEMRNHQKHCEFIGCSHIKEENCGIKEAVNMRRNSKREISKL